MMENSTKDRNWFNPPVARKSAQIALLPIGKKIAHIRTFPMPIRTAAGNAFKNKYL